MVLRFRVVGDNPFRWEESGGVGAVWNKTAPDRTGSIKVTATHSLLDRTSVEITTNHSQKLFPGA
jgi:hypothetical protein